jgi:hypothetical protein
LLTLTNSQRVPLPCPLHAFFLVMPAF